jgi:hypothetical protein
LEFRFNISVSLQLLATSTEHELLNSIVDSAAGCIKQAYDGTRFRYEVKDSSVSLGWGEYTLYNKEIDDMSAKIVMPDGRIMSYTTCIKEYHQEHQRWIGNITKYGPTTSRHQREAIVTECEVRLDSVPKGTTSLVAYYDEHCRLRL